MSDAPRVVRVVAPPHEDGGAQHTMGTKVLLPNGSEIPGVTRVVLVGEVNKPWVAHITCHVREVDITALEDTSRRFAEVCAGSSEAPQAASDGLEA